MWLGERVAKWPGGWVAGWTIGCVARLRVGWEDIWLGGLVLRAVFGCLIRVVVCVCGLAWSFVLGGGCLVVRDERSSAINLVVWLV